MKRTVFEFEDFRDSISFLYYKTCGRKALGGERFESGPSALGIGWGIGPLVVAVTVAASARLPVRNSPPF